jgi:predicted GNAT superfamily acetyltransferase
MAEIEDIQRQVWEGSETEIVPAHILIAIVKKWRLIDRGI